MSEKKTNFIGRISSQGAIYAAAGIQQTLLLSYELLCATIRNVMYVDYNGFQLAP